ncbi:MAG: acetoin utilization protein AcuC [Thermoprotei archaeon]|nr:MAG: acetoin utilization protein AcuC [Thermoprotei archaeon]
MSLSIAYRDEYLRIGFTPLELFETWSGRVGIFMKLIKETGFIEGINIIIPDPVSEELLLKVHSSEYVDYVRKMGKIGRGYLDYGDTPAYPNVFEKARLAVGGTVALVKMMLERKTDVGFNPQGGYHHARRNSAGGFCVFNDVALTAVLFYEAGLKRVAIIDIDGHHGDGTQEILYDKPILKISIHGYGMGFYPGTGWIEELGEGEGYGYSVNIPLPLGSGDDVFEYVMESVVSPVLESYKPQVLVLQMGADGHEGDPLVGLRYTSKSYLLFINTVRNIAEKYSEGRIIGTAGGGYRAEVAARMWALQLAQLAGYEEIIEKLRDSKEDTKTPKEIWEIVKERVKVLKELLSTVHKI